MSDALLAQYFVPASLWGLLRRGHPYDFIETYQTVQALYGYSAYYVNLGLWAQGAETVEPGRALMRQVAAPLKLSPGERLIDAGSGLGQAAVDLGRDWGPTCTQRRRGDGLGVHRAISRTYGVLAGRASCAATRSSPLLLPQHRHPAKAVAQLPRTTQWVIRSLQALSRRAVARGRIRYLLMHARADPT